jgi:hypothetical protein
MQSVVSISQLIDVDLVAQKVLLFQHYPSKVAGPKTKQTESMLLATQILGSLEYRVSER